MMWGRYVRAFLLTFCGGGVIAYAFILVMDPYDSGRFGPQWIAGAVDETPRTGDASRGRDARFNSAIIGNSHGQLIDPAHLHAATGLNFVQLTVPGTGPREQLTLLRWFVQHHDRIGAVVLAADQLWCTQDASLPVDNPFPFWLYSQSGVEYALNALRTAALDRGWRRLLLAVGLRKESNPVGYSDYERDRPWTFGDHAPRPPEGFKPAAEIRTPQRRFPAIDRLKLLLSRLPADARFVVVFPPVYVTELPAAGSDTAELMAECKGAFLALVGSKALVDFAVDSAEIRDPTNFMDVTHYRSALARQLESAIVAALNSGGS
jgi:hypothetical protein